MAKRPGSGIWLTAKALGKLQRRYFDIETGQAGYFGTLEEETGTAVVTVRLKIEDRKISVLFLAIGGELTGTLSPEKTDIVGNWTQGATMRLTLSKKVSGK